MKMNLWLHNSWSDWHVSHHVIRCFTFLCWWQETNIPTLTCRLWTHREDERKSQCWILQLRASDGPRHWNQLNQYVDMSQRQRRHLDWTHVACCVVSSCPGCVLTLNTDQRESVSLLKLITQRKKRQIREIWTFLWLNFQVSAESFDMKWVSVLKCLYSVYLQVNQLWELPANQRGLLMKFNV